MSVYSYLGMSTTMMIAMTINDDDGDGGGGDNGDTNDNGNSKSVADDHDNMVLICGVDIW